MILSEPSSSVQIALEGKRWKNDGIIEEICMCEVSREARAQGVWDRERTKTRKGGGEGGRHAWWGRQNYPLSAKSFNSSGSFHLFSHSMRYGLHSTGKKTDLERPRDFCKAMLSVKARIQSQVVLASEHLFFLV